MQIENVYNIATVNEFIQRINHLTPNSQRQWGKMDATQMMTHCSALLEVALGDVKAKQGVMGKLIGRFVKSVITNDKPIKKDMPTDPSFVMTGTSKDFNAEKEKLAVLLTRFSKNGPEAAEKYRHPFFGKMTGEEWSISMYKHLDHHLRQFGA